MYVFASVAVCVVLAALAVCLSAFAKDRRALIAFTALSALTFAAGLAAAIISACRFSQVEMHNEWAIDAFRSFFNPTLSVSLISGFILAASAATGKRRIKTVICLAAAALFCAAITAYTALFSVLSEHPTSFVQSFIRAAGVGCAATFALVPATVGAKEITVRALNDRRSNNQEIKQ